MIELECRKRVFWCAYTLDNYLSAALGRPRTFHDDDIDQELPSCVNDSDLTSKHVYINKSKAQSIMMAPIAHAMLVQEDSTYATALTPSQVVSNNQPYSPRSLFHSTTIFHCSSFSSRKIL
ncbi:hypothetical protein DSL72_003348 [Monilinia vaccinii-corymbosi]|uniref:Xylanolytic transcriptional activator regulatory domain-containing protein n=1 Tax=Monilinia vaccinii-corymbosi TaxID=61207 RepID=A0A8A3NTQ7_9HELO|nr:hypothetical protein DSL72_003348 [Monilinia vaccinii-corymbosi]